MRPNASQGFFQSSYSLILFYLNVFICYKCYSHLVDLLFIHTYILLSVELYVMENHIHAGKKNISKRQSPNPTPLHRSFVGDLYFLLSWWLFSNIKAKKIIVNITWLNSEATLEMFVSSLLSSFVLNCHTVFQTFLKGSPVVNY